MDERRPFQERVGTPLFTLGTAMIAVPAFAAAFIEAEWVLVVMAAGFLCAIAGLYFCVAPRPAGNAAKQQLVPLAVVVLRWLSRLSRFSHLFFFPYLLLDIGKQIRKTGSTGSSSFSLGSRPAQLSDARAVRIVLKRPA